jgi:hypothetical protein
MGCGDACPLVPAPVTDWDLPDPKEMPLPQVREVRDDIEHRMTALLVEMGLAPAH